MDSFFPVLFAVGLMSDPTPLVDHVYQMWIGWYVNELTHIYEDEYEDRVIDRYSKDIFKAIYTESKVQLPGDALHNQYINYYCPNYYTEKSSSDKENVTTPSKVYVYSNMLSDSCKHLFNLDKNALSLALESCTLQPEQMNHIMHELSECNEIRKVYLLNTSLHDVSYLFLSNKRRLIFLHLENTNMSAELSQSFCSQLSDLTHLEHLIVKENDFSQVSKLTLNNKRNLKYLYLENTQMSLTLYNTICQQITDLECLEKFDVSAENSCYKIDDKFGYHTLHCDLSHSHFPPELCRHVFHNINRFCLNSIEITQSPVTGCLSSLVPHPNLWKLFLTGTELNKDDLQHLSNIIQGNKLPNLRCLVLSHNTLAGCLPGLLQDPHPGLPHLELLYLRDTALNKDDVQHLLSIAHALPKLWKLDLSEYTLTGCLSSFLPDPHPGLPQLEKLNLEHTALKKDDVQHLSNITQSNKLPKLRDLSLSDNDMTGCLSSFLPDSHPGLPQLKELDLKRTELNKDDLKHLTHLIQTHKLPELGWLGLSWNRLYEMETDVGHLIEACVTHHQRELKLQLWHNNLSKVFRNKWEEHCKGTNIELRWWLQSLCYFVV